MLNKNIVLMLNRNWQAINIRTTANTFCQTATDVTDFVDKFILAGGVFGVISATLISMDAKTVETAEGLKVLQNRPRRH